MELVNILSQEIKKKKTLTGLSKSILDREINQFFKRNPRVLKELSEKDLKSIKRSAIFKKVLKEVRKNLHRSHGAFLSPNSSKRNQLLEKRDFIGILKTNLSTKERLDHYDNLYQRVFEITSKPKSILDLGSGLNPISFYFMKLKTLDYIATEINENDISFLNDYFKLMKTKGLNGKALTLDLTQGESLNTLKEISKTDICFMFKLLESLEFIKKKKYKLIENVLNSTKSKWIVVSFATKTLSQKRMKFTQRKWFELMLQRLKKQSVKIEFNNETFYIIKNQ